jgi:hypothetical protein
MQVIHSAWASRALALGVLAMVTLGATAGQATSAHERLAAQSLEGVWRVAKVVKVGANAGTDSHPQPSLQIFYRGYFSIVRDNSSEPRKPSPAPADPANLTDSEKIARYDEWAPFGASAGTYEVEGDTLITHNVVAKQVRGMTLTEEATIKFEGRDRFVATAKFEPGVPPGRQTTYTRVR